MALLNYTTTIKAEKTAGEIHALLAKAGAEAILTEYQAGVPSALSFVIGTRFGERSFRMPVDPKPVLAVLRRQWSKGEVARRFVEEGQAARVAWRITKDWIEAQLALIETEMVRLDQVLLPYMTTDTGQTVYEAFSDRQFQLDAGPRVLEAGEE